MFYGEYEHTIDRKGRIIIPSKFRQALKEHMVEKLYVTRGLDRCLFLFTEEEWRMQESKFKSISFTKQEARQFNRLYFSGACDVTCDKQGRILIPKNLKEFAEIKRDIVIVGVSNRIEFWSKERWQEFSKTSQEAFEQVAEKILET